MKKFLSPRRSFPARRNFLPINVGRVSNSVKQDLRASYAFIEASCRGYTVELRRVEYDRDAVIAAVQQTRHPAGPFIIRYMRGAHVPYWSKARH